MSKKHVQWLCEELPGLVSAGVLPAESAEKLRQHYGAVERGGGRRWAVVLFGIVGAALIGGGIILLLAHNWEQLSRPVRAAIAFVPLLAAQAAGGWILWTDRKSTALREGVGTFLVLAIGGCLALVAQSYQLGGSLEQFLLTWTLLGLPVAYLLGTTLPALLYLVAITVWTGAAWDEGWKSLGYWPLLALALPYWWLVARRHRYHPRPVLFAWVLVLTLPIGMGLSLHRVLDQTAVWIMLYSALGGVMFLAGNRWWGEATTFWQRPLQNFSAWNLAGLAVALSFTDLWKELVRAGGWAHWPEPAWLKVAAAGAVAVWPVAAIGLWVDCLCRRNWAAALMGGMPLVAWLGYALAGSGQSPGLGAALFDLYLLALGVGTLVVGVRGQRLGLVNAGMLVLAALILARFFDADLGFVVRGVAFILLGAGFLATNLVLLRQKGATR